MIPRELVAALRLDPSDLDSAAVLADWCEEHAFQSAAEGLRAAPGSLPFRHALACIQWLVGSSAAAGGGTASMGAYDYVLKFAEQVVEACDEATFTVDVAEAFILRRFVLGPAPSLLTYYTSPGPGPGIPSLPMLGVVQIAVNGVALLRGEPNGGVSGALFGVDGPELFEEAVPSGAVITVLIENTSKRDLWLRACLLGRRRADG